MPSTEEKNSRRREIWRDFWKGILVTLLILGAVWWFEHTSSGEQVKAFTYDFLQRKLMSSRRDEDIPVAVVDISDLEVAPVNIDGETYRATPRDELLRLIEAIADQEPVAVGVDIDFSPNEAGYITPHDPQFFQSCLDIGEKKQTPVLLGIRRSQIYPRERWLGVEEYAGLAASVFVPKSDNRKMWEWIKPDEGAEPVPTMSALLAEKLRRSRKKLPPSLSWAAERLSERELGPGYTVGEFLVDYSPLDAIEKMRVRTAEPEGVTAQGHLLENKVVLVGDGTPGKARDMFNVPGRQQPVPGVYLHACAAYTLAGSALYKLTLAGRVVIDLLLSFAVLGAITAIRLYHLNRTPGEVNTHWLQGVLTFVVVLAAIAMGVLFVHVTHVLWDDFILAAAGLLLHPKVDRWLSGGRSFLRDDLRPVIMRRLFKSRTEG